MPKSKRSRIVHLTKTTKKSRESKAFLITKIQKLCDSYSHIYIITIGNERNRFIKDLRRAMSEDVFVFGSNRVISRALGRTESEEYKPGVHNLANLLSGHVGLLFSNKKPEEIVTFLSNIESKEYARCGSLSTEDVLLSKGLLKKLSGEDIPHSMEEHLRNIGLPTKLENGKVVLLADYMVCRRGQKLSVDQAKILKHIGMMLATICAHVEYVWNEGNICNLSNWPELLPLTTNEKK